MIAFGIQEVRQTFRIHSCGFHAHDCVRNRQVMLDQPLEKRLIAIFCVLKRVRFEEYLPGHFAYCHCKSLGSDIDTNTIFDYYHGNLQAM